MQESKFLYRLRPKNLLLLFALRKDVYNLLPRSCFPWCYDWHSSNRFSPPEKCNKNEAVPFEVLPSLHIKTTLNNFQAFVLISSRCRIQHVCNFFSWCLRTLQLFPLCSILSVLSWHEYAGVPVVWSPRPLIGDAWNVQRAGATVWEWDSSTLALITADSSVWLAGPTRRLVEGFAQALMLRSI